MDDSKQTFGTTDVALAAFLITHGYKCSQIHRAQSRGTFVFLNVDAELIDQYDRDEAVVNPRQFYDNIRHVISTVKRG